MARILVCKHCGKAKTWWAELIGCPDDPSGRKQHKWRDIAGDGWHW